MPNLPKHQDTMPRSTLSTTLAACPSDEGLNEQINTVYELYDQTEDEIRIVEGYKPIANHISYCRVYLSRLCCGKYDMLLSPLAWCAQHGLTIFTK
jgi:hypothetical protein